jgi:hypothetical protein
MARSGTTCATWRRSPAGRVRRTPGAHHRRGTCDRPYVFADPRARTFFADWDDVADEQAFDLWHGPSVDDYEWLTAELAPIAGPDFTRRLNSHLVPRRGVLRLNHPAGHELQFLREILEFPTDARQLVVFLPADQQTARAVEELLLPPYRPLRVVS